MTDALRSHLLVPVALLALGLFAARAENVDPPDDGHQWAWSENAGWINAQPLGPGGPGAEVGDFRLTGFLWAENLGWINLGCLPDGSCDAPDLGVRNDGRGRLSGFAWAENAGFVNFAPAGGGVRVVAGPEGEGVLTGLAWGENIGWIQFSTGDAYAIQTTWSCPAAPAPAGSPDLSLTIEDGGTRLAWTAVADATHYDAVRGDLPALLAATGDFAAAGVACVARKVASLSVLDGLTDASPPPGLSLIHI